MNTSHLFADFDSPELPSSLSWYCPPAHWSIASSHLVVEPGGKTDYWQKTHYGFAVDNGPFLYTSVNGNFVLSTKVRFFPKNQYDQAGLMVRYDADHWLKTSVEFEHDIPPNLGAVVTNRGYSDWSTQPYPAGLNEIDLRITRTGDDYLVQCLLPGPSSSWTQIRLARLHNPSGSAVQCGLYACSPIAAGYRAEFEFLKIEIPE